MTTHTLKILPQFYAAVADGSKPFEVRKDDRGFQKGDTLILNEVYVMHDGRLSENGNTLERHVTYVMPGGQFGIEVGYVVLGLSTKRGKA